MNDHVGNIDGLVLCVKGLCDVGEIKKFFNSGKDGCDWFLGMVSLLLDDVLALKDFVRHQLPVVVL